MKIEDVTGTPRPHEDVTVNILVTRHLLWTRWPKGVKLPEIDSVWERKEPLRLPEEQFAEMRERGLAGTTDGVNWIYVRDVP